MDLREESIGPLNLVSSSAKKTDVCSVTGTDTHKQASDNAAGTNSFYEPSQGNVSEDATTNARLDEPNFIQIKQEPPEEPSVADIPYQSSVDNGTTKDGGICHSKEEMPNEVRDFSNEYTYNSSVDVPLNLCSKVYIKEEEDLSSQDDVLSEDSEDESVKPIGQHFSTHYTVKRDEPPRTPGPTHASFVKEEAFARPSFDPEYAPQYSRAPRTPGPTHAVFIKEEVCERASFESEAVSQNSVADESTFGNHFLTQCLEPRQPQYQYANGLSAENECDSSLDLSVLGHQTLQVEQASAPGRKNNEIIKMDTDGLMVYTERRVNYQQIINRAKHVNWSGKRPLNKRCPQCAYVTRSKYVLELHVTRVHGNPERYFCSYCPYNTTIKSCIFAHLTNKHKAYLEPIKCPYCRLKFLSIPEVEEHIQTKHRRQRVTYFFCPHCKHKSRSERSLERHVAVKHTMAVRYKCGLCDFKCWPKDVIKKHYKSHPVSKRAAVQVDEQE